jgi:hypothetical protein
MKSLPGQTYYNQGGEKAVKNQTLVLTTGFFTHIILAKERIKRSLDAGT